jgi:hypothetical protein
LIIKQNNEYKSPVSALLWSFTLAGFGQVYNGQIILGVIFMLWELGVNILSNLNLSIYESFHGHFQKSHEVINPEWGLFYPSIWTFSMWQAYNKAKTINAQNEGKQHKEVNLTGFFFGLTFGMNLGIYWHVHVPNKCPFINVLSSPVFNGLFLGMIVGIIGHLIERYQTKRKIKR